MGYTESTSERSPKRAAGLWFRICFGLALTAFFLKSLFRCRFFLGGDATLFVRDVGLLSNGYLQKNLEALRSASEGGLGQHVQCATEAGSVSIFWLASHLSWEAVFYVNALFLMGAVAALCLLFRALLRETGYADLVAGWVLLLLVVSPVFEPLLNLARPFRDTSALCFSLWGLCFLTTAMAHVRRGKAWRLALSGFLLGMASWMRIPNIIVAVPAGLYLLSESWRESRHNKSGYQRMALIGSVALWGAMVAIGPGLVVAQGYLETGRLAAPGRANVAMVSKSIQKEEPAGATVSSPVSSSGLQKGVHWGNASQRLMGVFRQVMAQQFVRRRWGGLMLLAVAALFCRRALLGLAFAAPLVLFYGCYDKVVLRYNIPAILLVGGVLACSVAALSMRLLRRLRGLCPRVETSMAGAFLLLIAAFLARPTVDEYRSFVAQRDTARTTVTWIRDVTQTHAAVVTSWTALASLVSLVSPETFVVKEWVSLHLWDDGERKRAEPGTRYGMRDAVARDKFDRLIKLLDQGGHALLVLRYASDGGESESWVKDDLMHYFHLRAAPALSFDSGSHETSFFVYEIEPLEHSPRQIKMAVGDPNANLMLVQVRTLCTTNHWQATTIIAGDREATTKLEAGMNLVPVPASSSGRAVELVGQEPLPSIVRAVPMGVEPVAIDLGAYGQAPSNIRLTEGIRIEWAGYKMWFRDWGGDGRAAHRSHPVFLLSADATNRLQVTRPIQPYVIRLNYRMGLRQEVSGWPADTLTYSCDGYSIETNSVGAYRYDEDYRLMQELEVSAGASSDSAYLDIAMDTGRVAVAELTSIDYMLRPSLAPSPSPSPVISVLHKPPPDTALRSVVPEDFRYLGVKPAGFRWPAGQNGKVVFFGLVNTAPTPAPVRVACQWGDRLGWLDLPAQPSMALVALPCRLGEAGDIGFWLQNQTLEARVYAMRMMTRTVADFRIPLDVSVDDDPMYSDAEGLYSPHRRPDGTLFCWTSGLVALQSAVFDAPRDAEAILDVVGAPAPVGPLAVTMRVNGHALPPQEVKPEARVALRWQVPAEMLNVGLNRIVISVPTWQPSVVTGSADERELGIMFRGLMWR